MDFADFGADVTELAEHGSTALEAFSKGIIIAECVFDIYVASRFLKDDGIVWEVAVAVVAVSSMVAVLALCIDHSDASITKQVTKMEIVKLFSEIADVLGFALLGIADCEGQPFWLSVVIFTLYVISTAIQMLQFQKCRMICEKTNAVDELNGINLRRVGTLMTGVIFATAFRTRIPVYASVLVGFVNLFSLAILKFWPDLPWISTLLLHPITTVGPVVILYLTSSSWMICSNITFVMLTFWFLQCLIGQLGDCILDVSTDDKANEPPSDPSECGLFFAHVAHRILNGAVAVISIFAASKFVQGDKVSNELSIGIFAMSAILLLFSALSPSNLDERITFSVLGAWLQVIVVALTVVLLAIEGSAADQYLWAPYSIFSITVICFAMKLFLDSDPVGSVDEDTFRVVEEGRVSTFVETIVPIIIAAGFRDKVPVWVSIVVGLSSILSAALSHFIFGRTEQSKPAGWPIKIVFDPFFSIMVTGNLFVLTKDKWNVRSDMVWVVLGLIYLSVFYFRFLAFEVRNVRVRADTLATKAPREEPAESTSSDDIESGRSDG